MLALLHSFDSKLTYPQIHFAFKQKTTDADATFSWNRKTTDADATFSWNRKKIEAQINEWAHPTNGAIGRLNVEKKAGKWRVLMASAYAFVDQDASAEAAAAPAQAAAQPVPSASNAVFDRSSPIPEDP
jgi:hypothetical protein